MTRSTGREVSSRVRDFTSVVVLAADDEHRLVLVLLDQMAEGRVGLDELGRQDLVWDEVGPSAEMDEIAISTELPSSLPSSLAGPSRSRPGSKQGRGLTSVSSSLLSFPHLTCSGMPPPFVQRTNGTDCFLRRASTRRAPGNTISPFLSTPS